MGETYDVVIIGGGPAGLTAGIYASRARLNTLVLQKGKPGGQAATTQEMENYPGFGRGTTGPELMNAITEHAKSFDTKILNEDVIDVELEGDIKKVITKSGKEFLAKTIILAPGAEPRTLNVKGEQEFRGMGVSYCATCDADFFEDLDVVVVGNGDAAIEEAIYLTKFAETVTIIVIHDEGILDCNKTSAERAFSNPKIKWIWNSTLEEIKGDGLVEAVVIKNIKTGELTEKKTDGVFFFVGTVPKTSFLKGKVTLNEHGYIITNELMETSVPGVFAAGDAREKFLRQVITAASDGAIAAVAAEKYLTEEESFKEKVLNSDKLVMVAFWSPQNEKSLEAISILEKYTSEDDSVDLFKIDTYKNKRISDKYEVEDVPTVLFFDKGEKVASINGFFELDTIKEKVKLLKK